MRVMRILIAVSIGIAQACGNPSPWSNIINPNYHDLTRHELDRLGGADEDFQPFSVGLIADPQVFPGALRLAVNAIDYRDDISFSLILGDLTDRSLRSEFIWVANIIKSARLPILTAVGNHDGLIYGKEIYKDMFGELNYSFVFRGVKFVIWNNNPYEWGYPDFQWLEQQIESYPRILIVAHQPPGSIERYEEINDRFITALEHPHVLASVHGHRHNYNLKMIAGKPALTVARVFDTKFAIMRIAENFQITFERCKGRVCQ